MARLFQVADDLEDIQKLFQKEAEYVESDKLDLNDAEALENSMKNTVQIGFTAFKLLTEEQALLSILEYKTNIAMNDKLIGIDRAETEKIKKYVEGMKPINELAIKYFEKFKAGRVADFSIELIREILADRGNPNQ